MILRSTVSHWDTILRHKDAYADCITHHCTALLYLSGPEIRWPHPSADPTRHHYPLYVSLIDARDDTLFFAQAYAIPELSAVPLYLGTYPHTTASGDVFRQSNENGLSDTWLFRNLTGTGSRTHVFYLEEDDGSRTKYAYRYPGYRIRKAVDASGEGHHMRRPTEERAVGDELPLQKTTKYLSLGHEAEKAGVEHSLYKKYLRRANTAESTLPQLVQRSATLWFPSEQELYGYSLEDARGTTGTLPRSLYLKSESYLPALADSWRSSEAYWLRSTPSAYLTDEIYEENEMDDPATRDEYFLQADGSGQATIAHYDGSAAVRLMFSVK